MIALSTEQGFPFWLATGTILRGWALAEQGQEEEGIAQMRQGLDAWRATGAELCRPYFLALLAEAYGKAGQAEEGLTVLAEALATVDKTGERFYEAELYRLYGELSLRAGERANGRTGEKSEVAPSPARPVVLSSPEACFLKAIEIARKQQAKSLELRAVDESGPVTTTASPRSRNTYHATRITHQAQRSSPDVIRGLQLVHRRI